MDDPRDAKYQLIQELQADTATPSGSTPYGQVQWSDDVLNWMQKKQEMGVKVQFEEWFGKNFDKMGPVQKALAKKLYPNFYSQRLATLKDNTNLLGELARIRLQGVQSKSDLYLQFAADRGLIDLSQIQDILHPEKTSQYSGRAFQRGLFNSRRLMFGDPGPRHSVESRAQNSKQFVGMRPENYSSPRAAKPWPMGFERSDVTANQFNVWA